MWMRSSIAIIVRVLPLQSYHDKQTAPLSVIIRTIRFPLAIKHFHQSPSTCYIDNIH